MKFDFLHKKDSTGMMMFNTASSQMYSNIIRILSGLITARLVMPDVLGTFNAFALIISYLPILQIGIMNALNRNLPYYIGKGDMETAKRQAATTNAWELFLGVVTGSILLTMGVVNLFLKNYQNTWGYITIAIMAFHYFYGTNYLQILYRTNNDFNKLARITMIDSTVTFLSVVFVWLWGFNGLCIRQVICSLLGLVLLWIWKPMSVRPEFEKRVFVDMVKIGFPIFLVGLVFAYWGTINNTIVLKLGGTQEYGFYALATMVYGVMSVFSSSIGQVLYPKMSMLYGSGAEIKDIIKLPTKYILTVLAFLIPTIILIWMLLPWAVSLLLPNYLPGIKAAQWMTLLLIPSLLGVYNNVFNINKRQVDYLVSIIIGIVIYLICVFVLKKAIGYSLSIFPISLVVGRIGQLVVAIFYFKRYLKG